MSGVKCAGVTFHHLNPVVQDEPDEGFCSGLAELLWPAREVERTALSQSNPLWHASSSCSCRSSVNGSGENGISAGISSAVGITSITFALELLLE